MARRNVVYVRDAQKIRHIQIQFSKSRSYWVIDGELRNVNYFLAYREDEVPSQYKNI